MLTTVVALAMAVAFFTGHEPRGPTARLDSDAYYYYVALPSLVVDGDLDFTNQYSAYGNWYGFSETPAGRPGNAFGIGPAIFGSPFFLVGRAVAWAAGLKHDGFSRPEVLATLFASVVFSIGALVMTARFLRRRFPGGAPLVVALVVMLGGPVIYYAIRQPGYAHPFAAFFTAWLVDAWDASYEGQAPRSRRVWITLGSLLGAAVLARPQLVTWGVVLLAALADDLGRARRGRASAARIVTNALVAFAAALLVFAPQLWAWRSIYGRAFLVPQGGGFLAWSEPALSEVLFSARNGLFAWSPIYALAALGLVLELRSRAGLVLCLAVLLQVFVNGAAWDWWAGGSFGGRRFCSTYVAFAFGLASLFVRVRRPLDARLPGLAAQLGLLVGATAALGNVALALSYASSTVRIAGGEMPSLVMRRRLGPKLGGVVGAMSDAVLAIPRALFALRYGTSWSSYDEVVGVFQLNERYPGLNVDAPQRTSQIRFDESTLPPGSVGLTSSVAGAILERGRATVLVSLNEHRTRGGLELDASDAVELVWNGSSLRLSSTGLPVRAPLAAFRRGVNVLEIRGRPGTLLHTLRLHSVTP